MINLIKLGLEDLLVDRFVYGDFCFLFFFKYFKICVILERWVFKIDCFEKLFLLEDFMVLYLKV